MMILAITAGIVLTFRFFGPITALGFLLVVGFVEHIFGGGSNEGYERNRNGELELSPNPLGVGLLPESNDAYPGLYAAFNNELDRQHKERAEHQTL